MKVKVKCPMCSEVIDWIWNNSTMICDNCHSLLDIKDVKVAKESYKDFMPLS